MNSFFFTAAAVLLLVAPSQILSQTDESSPQDTASIDTSGIDTASDNYGFFDGSDPPARFEIGVLIGEPMAISAKYWLNSVIGIDAGVGWSFDEAGKLDVLGDFLVHPYYIPLDFGDLPLYLGAGATFRVGDGDSFLGVRFPLGAELLFSGFPVSVFGEVVPVMEVIPDMGFRLEGGAGIRFVFGRQ